MLEFGVIGIWVDIEDPEHLNGRYVIWDMYHFRNSAKFLVEIQRFLPDFNMELDPEDFAFCLYQFSDTDKVHRLEIGEECFCLSLDTLKMTRVPFIDVCQKFTRMD